MKVFLGLRKTVDDCWTSGSMCLTEPEGILCKLDDGRGIAVTHDGRVLTFDAEGRMLSDTAVPQVPDGNGVQHD